MRKILFIALFFTSQVVFGQQYLWSTAKVNSTTVEFSKIIPMDKVTDEVLKFYDVYRGYHDLSGYSKEAFMKEAMADLTKLNWLTEIEEPTVFAIRANSGSGSYVAVICVSKKNVNAIVFSNSVIKDGGDYNLAVGMDPEKFTRWFKTLLN